MGSAEIPEDEAPEVVTEGGGLRLTSRFSMTVDEAGSVEVSIEGLTIEVAEPDAS